MQAFRLGDSSIDAQRKTAAETRKPRADGARNRQRLIDAAKAGFAEVGMHVALEEIARRAGVGIGILQVPLAVGPPRLRRLLPKVSFDLPIWVVTHEDLRASRRVSIVFDHLVASLTKYIRAAS